MFGGSTETVRGGEVLSFHASCAFSIKLVTWVLTFMYVDTSLLTFNDDDAVSSSSSLLMMGCDDDVALLPKLDCEVRAFAISVIISSSASFYSAKSPSPSSSVMSIRVVVVELALLSLYILLCIDCCHGGWSMSNFCCSLLEDVDDIVGRLLWSGGC